MNHILLGILGVWIAVFGMVGIICLMFGIVFGLTWLDKRHRNISQALGWLLVALTISGIGAVIGATS